MLDNLVAPALNDLETFAPGFLRHDFRLHREKAPVWWHEPIPHTPDDEGFWSVATYPEVLQVLNDPPTLRKWEAADHTADDPRHARIQRLVTRCLTPAARICLVSP